MNPIAIGVLVFMSMVGGALAGIWLRTVLPPHHFSDEAKDTVKTGIGLVATMTALVLGLIIASARTTFERLDAAVKHSAADVLALDRALARYGPAAKELRLALHDVVGQRLEMTWPQERSRVARLDKSDATRGGEQFVARIRDLSPQNDEQRSLQSRALDLSEAVLNAHWVVVSALGPSVPALFLTVLTCWLTIIFASFGLFAPRNATVMAVLLVCALSVSAAIFLVLEMDGPFDGLIRISPDPLRYAHARINQ